ncbi:MAG: exopolysaccharide biosynthesis protein [Alphaproteobacteria bacterium]|nr:exopolysaccharide biosynthesis protein [Alphaproteobacteria bacterium]
MDQIRPLSTLLNDMRTALPAEDVPLRMLVDQLHERGFGGLLLLFAMPMALPVPVPPGVNIALATPLVFLTGQQTLGAHMLWLPGGLTRKTLARERVSSWLSAMIPPLQKLEKITRPRWRWATQNGASRFFGFLGLLMALTVCIPLPLTNTVPSLGISLMAIGTLMRDGVAVVVGALIGSLWIALLITAAFLFGPDAIAMIKTLFKSF